MVNVKIIVVFICCISITAHGNAVTKIINGTVIDDNVSFLVYISSTTNPKFRCTGTIIDKQYVLTGASCFNSIPSSEMLEVHYNNNIFPIEKKNIHEDFIAGKQGPNDIALIKLSSEIKPDHTVLSITEKLPSTGILYGWGVLSADSTSYPKKPHLTVVTIKDSKACKKLLPEVSPNVNTNICSPELKGGCFGDVGGPLVTLSDIPPKLIGIVTWGYTSCDEPTVYTNMLLYDKWVKENMKKM